MLKALTDTLASDCFAPRTDYVVPSPLKTVAMEGEDDVMSADNSDSSMRLAESPSIAPPPEIEVPLPVAPSTPIQNNIAQELREPPSPPRKNVLPILRPETPSPQSHVRSPQRVSYQPMSPSQILKRANPLDTTIVMKEYYEKPDDETVCTEASTVYTSSVSDTESEDENVRVKWRKRSIFFGGSTDSSQEEPSSTRKCVELDWKHAVVEETEEGFKIHAPPELLRFPVLNKEDDWEFVGTRRLAPRCNKKVLTGFFRYGDDEGLSFRSPYLPEGEIEVSN